MVIDIEKLCKRNETLDGQNANWRNYHQDLADYCLPRKANQTTIRYKGDRLKLNFLFDTTALRALKIMSAGFHSNLTNPASKWFTMQTRNIDFMEFPEVRIWFNRVENKMFSVLNSSNFDTTMQEFYTDAGCFGTGVILTLDDIQDKVRFTICPLNGINIEEDSQGRVNRLYRNYTMTVQQAYDLWGNNAGEVVREKIKDNPQDEVKILHYVGPRDYRDSNKDDAVNMPYVSCWVEKSKKHLIKESGFFDFPYVVGRFYKDASDVFGFSPAMDALAAIKLLNAQKRTVLRAAMKQSDPPLIIPSRGFILPLNLNPSALNYRDPKSTNKDDLQTIPTNGNIPINLEVMDMEKRAIEETFFVPLFRALSDITKQMTVPEVQRRIAENMVLLGPVVGRFTDEVLDPLLVRVFNILYRSGELPEPPDMIKDQEMDIVYISPLAKAQRESEMFAIESFLGNVGAIASVKPEVLDKINEDKVVDIVSRIKGINPDILRSDEEVKAIRDARAQQAMMAQQMALMQQGADTVKVGADIDKTMAEAGAPAK